MRSSFYSDVYSRRRDAAFIESFSVAAVSAAAKAGLVHFFFAPRDAFFAPRAAFVFFPPVFRPPPFTFATRALRSSLLPAPECFEVCGLSEFPPPCVFFAAGAGLPFPSPCG